MLMAQEQTQSSKDIITEAYIKVIQHPGDLRQFLEFMDVAIRYGKCGGLDAYWLRLVEQATKLTFKSE